MSFKMKREQYSQMFGPTTGDSVRLGDTDLFIRVEKDYTNYGEEAVFGGGKVIRDGMGQNSRLSREDNPDVPDTVITNALILDYTGIIKADVGIRDGDISGIGKAGNPDIQDGVTIPIGPTTDVIAGEGKILTAGALDTHIHVINPEQADMSLSNGVTTMIGGGSGPTDGSRATTATPGPWHIKTILKAFEELPVNVGLTGKGQGMEKALDEQIAAGAVGFKVHEDWGSTPSAIDRALQSAEKHDVQVTLHADTLNESGFFEDTMEAIGDRVLHAYHTEGAGGGHAPDILRAAGYENILPASTNPTLPYTVNTIDEHLDMIMVCHHLNPSVPEDVAFADSRVRAETIAAEDVLHDMGVMSVIGSDSQAMGRPGEVVLRTWQLADSMKKQRGAMEGDSKHADNERAKRYVAKYTINPAIAHGISDHVGSIEEGKMADLALWDPQFFGAKPELVLKSGEIALSQMGDANASIPTPQPVMQRPMFGSLGKARSQSSATFVSQLAYDNGIKEELGLEKKVLPVKNIRKLSKSDMKLNTATPDIEVDPQTYEVRIDGEHITSEPTDEVSLGQRYFLF